MFIYYFSKDNNMTNETKNVDFRIKKFETTFATLFDRGN